MTAKTPKDKTRKPEPPEPVDVSDGIPDRKTAMSVPVIVVLIAIFVIWCVFLLYCQYGGRV